MAVHEGAAMRRTITGARRRRRWEDILPPYLFVLPVLLVFVVMRLGPSIYGLGLSFFRYRGYGEARWTGLDNYLTLLKYDAFWIQMRNTMFYWIAHTLPMMCIAFLLAILVNSRLARGARIIKPTIFLPQVVASVTAALVFRNFFGREYGVLNAILGTDIPWLEDMVLARWAVVIVLIWRETGYWFVIFMAGLTSVPPEVLEAAIVDGANNWQSLTRITIPLMRNTFLFAFVVDGIHSLKLYGVPNVLGGVSSPSCPLGMAPVLNTLVGSIRGGQFGRAAAAGWLVFVVILAISRIQFLVLGRREKEA